MQTNCPSTFVILFPIRQPDRSSLAYAREAALIQAEKLAIASRLAASIAHEINNPLEAITNLLYLASKGDDAAAPKSYAAQALEEVGRVSHITQQTLKFYRQSTAQSSVQVSEILDSLLVLYHGKLLAKAW
jgi:two-component system CheB/CheR fusion protein